MKTERPWWWVMNAGALIFVGGLILMFWGVYPLESGLTACGALFLSLAGYAGIGHVRGRNFDREVRPSIARAMVHPKGFRNGLEAEGWEEERPPRK